MTEQREPAVAVPPPVPTRAGWREFLTTYGTLLGFVVMVVFFSILRPDTFASVATARNVLEQASPIILVAVGFTVVIAAEEFDLSFTGSTLLSGVLAVKALSEWGWGPAGAVVVALLTGVACGLVSGLLVATKRASSLISTLALGTIWTGVALGVSDEGRTILVNSEAYLDLTFRRPLGIPLAVIYALVVVIVAFVLLRSTIFGRSVRALGSNEEAARLAGVRLTRTRITAFCFAGLAYGAAAVVLTSRSGQFSPDLTSGLLVPPFVAVFFGLSVLGAKKFNVIGTVVGALFIGTLETGLTVLGSSAWVSEIVTGAALVIVLFAAAGRR